MSKLPLVTGERMCKLVARLGFEFQHQTGSHTVWQHPDGRSTTIPVYSGEKLGRGLIRKILRDIELTPTEFRRLLR